MTWVRLDDRFTDHPKVAGVSDAAFRLHVSGLCWSARNLTDGNIARAIIGRLGVPNPAKKAAQLVDAGLWEATGDGWLIHDYLEFNPSKAKVEADRAKARERVNKARNKAQGSQDVRANTERTNARSSVAPTRPDPSPKTKPLSSAKNTDPVIHDDDRRLCRLLAEQIHANGSKKPRITQSWYDECRRLRERDGRPVAEIERLIRWCQSDPFWRANVLSMPTFRRKYDQLRLKAEGRNGNRGQAVEPDIVPLGDSG